MQLSEEFRNGDHHIFTVNPANTTKLEWKILDILALWRISFFAWRELADRTVYGEPRFTQLTAYIQKIGEREFQTYQKPIDTRAESCPNLASSSLHTDELTALKKLARQMSSSWEQDMEQQLTASESSVNSQEDDESSNDSSSCGSMPSLEEVDDTCPNDVIIQGTVPTTPDPVLATPDPVLATPDPVLATPDPVLATPDPVLATPDTVPNVFAEPVVLQPNLTTSDDSTSFVNAPTIDDVPNPVIKKGTLGIDGLVSFGDESFQMKPDDIIITYRKNTERFCWGEFYSEAPNDPTTEYDTLEKLAESLRQARTTEGFYNRLFITDIAIPENGFDAYAVFGPLTSEIIVLSLKSSYPPSDSSTSDDDEEPIIISGKTSESKAPGCAQQ